MNLKKDNQMLATPNLATTLDTGRTRRSFLKLAGKTMAVGAAATLLLSKKPPFLASAASTLQPMVDAHSFPEGTVYTSAVFNLGSSFDALAVYWEVNSGKGEYVQIHVRVSSDGQNFGDWLMVEQDETQESRYSANQITRYFGRLLLVKGTYVQYQLESDEADVKLVGLAPSVAGPSPKLPVIAQPTEPKNPTDAPYIISRAGWGANESYRFDNHGVDLWPAEYRTVKTIIIHHSDTTNTYNSDPAADVRSIYYYHAITKGWGDIGYNFLIDWKGNIYEGRHGGAGVVAGHAYQYNYGSIGICLIGNFFTAKPTQAQLTSLQNLLNNKCKVHSIDPLARIFFIDRNNVATISGHRDVINTTCPGDAAYSLLPGWRNSAKQALATAPDQTQNQPLALQLVSANFSPTTVPGGTMLRVDAVIKNTGTQVAHSQNPAPGFVYNEGDDFNTLGFGKQNGMVRFAVDFAGNTGTAYPYRWGLGKDLQPGDTVTITGYIKLKTNQVTSYWGGAVQEYIKYFNNNVGNQLVSVIPGNPTAAAASRANDPNIRYFTETSHNLGYSFRTYWEQHGGLAIFGYPVTEEFTEISPTDSKAYTVQYFERNRFEYHAELVKTGNPVLLGLLGVQLTQGRTFPKATPFQSTSSAVYFTETGHSLANDFLQYWNNHGGLAIFGYPISEELQEVNPEDHKTYTVQYFERNRFEYHPEFKGSDYVVELGLLGKQILRSKGWL
jgi:hypothetical protein